MASTYPSGLDVFTPLTGNEYCDTGIPDDTDLASRLNRLAAAIEAIQAELGANPSGADASVAAALDRTPTVLAIATAPLAAGQHWTGTLSAPEGWRVLGIDTDRPARIRAYGNATQRDADVSRPRGTDPTGDHGLLLDFVTTAADLAWTLSPAVDGWTPGGLIPVSVTNLGPTGAVSAHLLIVRTM